MSTATLAEKSGPPVQLSFPDYRNSELDGHASFCIGHSSPCSSRNLKKKVFSAVLGGLGFCYFIKLDSSSNSAFCSVLDNSGTSSGRKCQHCSSLTPHWRVLIWSEGPGSRATACERAKADHVAIRKLSSFSLSDTVFFVS